VAQRWSKQGCLSSGNMIWMLARRDNLAEADSSLICYNGCGWRI